jgi:hypothetical protein
VAKKHWSFSKLGVVQKLRQQFWNYFELLFLYSEKNVCTYETDRIGEKQPKETGNVNLIFERLLSAADCYLAVLELHYRIVLY